MTNEARCSRMATPQPPDAKGYFYLCSHLVAIRRQISCAIRRLALQGDQQVPDFMINFSLSTVIAQLKSAYVCLSAIFDS